MTRIAALAAAIACGACGEDTQTVTRKVEIELPERPSRPGACGPLVVKVAHDATVFFRGLTPVRIPRTQNDDDPAPLAAALARFRDDCVGPVDIRSERDVPYGRVVQLLAALKQHGFVEVTIAAE